MVLYKDTYDDLQKGFLQSHQTKMAQIERERLAAEKDKPKSIDDFASENGGGDASQSTSKEDDDDGDKKNWWESATGFIGDMAVDVYDKAKGTVQGNADVLQGQNSARNVKDATEARNEANANTSLYRESLKDEDFDKPEVKKKLKELNKAASDAGKIDEEDERQLKESQEVDATKVAADSAETYLNFATAGIGGALKQVVTKGGKAIGGKILKEQVKSGVKGAAAKAAEKKTKKEFADAAFQKTAEESAKGLKKQGVGKVLKGGAGGAAEGGIYSGAAGGYDAIGRGEDAEGVVRGAGEAVLPGILLGGALGSAGAGFGVSKNNKAVKTRDAKKAMDEARRADPTNPPEGGVDLTDLEIPQQLRERALNNGKGYIPYGKKIEEVAVGQKQLPATTETSTDISQKIDDMQQGNYADDMYDYQSSDGQNFSPEDISAATDKQVQILQGRMRDLEQQSTGTSNNTGKVDAPEGVDPSTYTADVDGRVKASEAMEGLQKQIDELQETGITPTGEPATGKTLNLDRVRQQFKDLRERNQTAKDQEAADAKFKEENSFKASGKTSGELSNEIDAAKNGDVPDSVKVEQPDFESTIEVGQAFPELREGLEEMYVRKGQLQDELDATITPEKVDGAKADVDAKYEAMRAKLKDVPEIRKKYEMSKIDEQHIDELSQIDKETSGMESSGKNIKAEIDEITAKEKDMVMRANFVKGNNPDRFMVVDAKKQADHIVELEAGKVLADTFPTADETSSVITNSMTRTKSKEQFQARMENDAAVEKSFQQKVESAQDLSVNSNRPGANIISSPIRVLRKFGDRGKYIADVLEEGNFAYARSRGEFVEKARSWKSMVKDINGNESNIFKSLDGEDVTLTQPEKLIRTQIREYLDLKGKELGLTDKTKIGEYIPHMFEQSYGKKYSEVEKIAAKIRYGVDEAGKKISAAEKEVLAKQIGSLDSETSGFLKSNNSWRVHNGFLEKRTGADGYSQDLFKVLSSYDNIANKKIHYEPAMELSRAVSTDMASEQKVFMESLFSKIKGDRSSVFEHTLDSVVGEGNTAKILGGHRRMSNLSIMGASPLTYAKNLQDSSKVFADRPIKHIVAALPDALRSMKYGSKVNRELFQNGIMEGSTPEFLKGMAEGTGVTKTGKAKTLALKGEQAMWSGMRATDAFTRGLNYRASILEFQANNPGKGMDEAIKFAQKTNRETVFTFSDFDIPVAMNNSIGRSTLNMQTYNLETAKYIGRMFGDVMEKGPNGKLTGRMSKKGMLKMSKYVAANTAFVATIGAGLGLKPAELLPFGNEISDGTLPQSPIISQLMGNDFQKGLVPTALNTSAQLFKAVTGQENELGGAVGDSLAATGDFAMSLIPGKTQFDRSRKGIESTATGEARSGNGNIQFNQDQDPLNTMVAAVFGKNTTQAGKIWKKQGMKTLSPEQMNLGTDGSNENISIDELSPEDKRLYVDFYNSVNNANPYSFDKKQTKRQGTVKKAREAALAGNRSKAKQLMQSYNDSARNEIQSFIEANGTDMPDEILEEMNKLLIEAGDVTK